MAVWYGESQGSIAVFGQRFTSGGVPSGAEFSMITKATAGYGEPAVASFSDGRSVVVWETELGKDGSGTAVYGQLLAADGAKDGTEFQVNTHWYGGQSRPSVATFPDGRFVVAWENWDAQDGSGAGVFAQRFATDKTLDGPEFQVNTYATDSQLAPSVAGFSDGGFVVAWQSNGQDGSSNGVFAQRFKADGSKDGVEFQVNSYTNSAQQYPSLAVLPDGGFVAAWESYDQDGSFYGVFAQRFDPDGNKIYH
jgi:hypothetical protein